MFRLSFLLLHCGKPNPCTLVSPSWVSISPSFLEVLPCVSSSSFSSVLFSPYRSLSTLVFQSSLVGVSKQFSWEEEDLKAAAFSTEWPNVSGTWAQRFSRRRTCTRPGKFPGSCTWVLTCEWEAFRSVSRETLLTHTSKPIVRLVESSGERSGTFSQWTWRSMPLGREILHSEIFSSVFYTLFSFIQSDWKWAEPFVI